MHRDLESHEQVKVRTENFINTTFSYSFNTFLYSKGFEIPLFKGLLLL